MEPVFEVFVVRQNRDLTEGRGPMQDKGFYPDEDTAYNALKATSGIMGTDSGKEIILRSYFLVNGAYEVTTENIWGYCSVPGGKWRFGWCDDRDLPENDPEWVEYMRLADKFKDVVK